MFAYHERPITDPGLMHAVLIIEALLFLYFIACNSFYLYTALVALAQLPAFVKRHFAQPARAVHSRFETPVTVIVPAFNESEHVIATVRSLLAFDYPSYEVVVVNDGSTDRTLELLATAFALEPSSEPYRISVPTADVHGIYRSATEPNLRVIDKANGGKGDALNAGINCASYPLVLCVDGDSFYVRETLACMVEPFLEDASTVVTAASIGVANGCEFADGSLRRVRLSRKPIVRFQVLEYLRAFLATREGWAPSNALSIVSGACGLYRKDVLVEAGGFRTDTIWEDMEMTIRVHHLMRARKRPYRVAFTPFVVCWTMVPETWGALWRQRVGWHRHLSEVLFIHRRLLCKPGSGAIGWAGIPFLFAFEWFAPVAVVLGITFGVFGYVQGFLSIWSQVVMLLLVLGLALLQSVGAIVLNELSFGAYRLGELARLLVSAVFENIGYRQFVMLANLSGLVMWLFRPRAQGRDLVGPTVASYDPARRADWRRAPEPPVRV
ncbi:MAG TPA: glycosyltransferase [Candidatus Limnocylindria bacterium]|jgi:cellulose synthase/poly-beta-1,6-N-acetylglucosamine synthase-like glycosyltransferase|nr:glycosyltransferase [Candidatus Limnocylindria bacterium]